MIYINVSILWCIEKEGSNIKNVLKFYDPNKFRAFLCSYEIYLWYKITIQYAKKGCKKSIRKLLHTIAT
jgi:hypothetical protein